MPSRRKPFRSRVRNRNGKRVLVFKKLDPLSGDFFGQAMMHGMTPNEYLAFVNKVNSGSKKSHRFRHYGPGYSPKPKAEHDNTDWKKWRRGE